MGIIKVSSHNGNKKLCKVYGNKSLNVAKGQKNISVEWKGKLRFF